MSKSQVGVLLTGGAGFIGSHTLVELIEAGYTNCIVADNFVNSGRDCVRKCEQLTGRKIKLHDIDLLDPAALRQVFKQDKVDVVIHFAGLKSVEESCREPLLYYHNNVVGSINLLMAMKEAGVNKIVFSSSATVYGSPEKLPIDESHSVGRCANPYGKTKYFIEEIIADHMKSIGGSYVNLRYFNPVGAHPSGMIGETPKGIPNNLVPYVARVATGTLPHVNVFGSDYNTPDGTGVRDYIHVVDLSRGHVAAVDHIVYSTSPVHKVFNLGTGKGYSVLEVVKAYERACGKKIPTVLCPRREGDVDCVYADIEKARRELKWNPQLDIDRMLEDSWRWQQNSSLNQGRDE